MENPDTRQIIAAKEEITRRRQVCQEIDDNEQ